jgi:hypothetical protein
VKQELQPYQESFKYSATELNEIVEKVSEKISNNSPQIIDLDTDGDDEKEELSL